MKNIRLLGVSGSLRRLSFNTALLHAMALHLSAHAQLQVYAGLGDLPLFNPDIADAPPTAAIQAWRDALRAADAVVFATPEYAHGVPGAFKNALDWVVGSGELVDKPMLLFSASSSPDGGNRSAAHVFGTLKVMTGDLVGDGPLCVGSVGKKIGPDGQLQDATTVGAVEARLALLLARVEQVRAGQQGR